MLDLTTAKKKKEAIDQKIGPRLVKLEDICRMEPIQVSTKCSGHTILATQNGDMTFLVWIQISDEEGVDIRKVKVVEW